MTLHEAIAQVLKESGKPLTCSEIAKKINNQKLYIREDKTDVPGTQISARLNHHRTIFAVDKSVTPMLVSLV